MQTVQITQTTHTEIVNAVVFDNQVRLQDPQWFRSVRKRPRTFDVENL